MGEEVCGVNICYKVAAFVVSYETSTNKDETKDYRLMTKTKLTVYNSVHCVTNCTEEENESKHKKATGTCYNLLV